MSSPYYQEQQFYFAPGVFIKVKYVVPSGKGRVVCKRVKGQEIHFEHLPGVPMIPRQMKYQADNFELLYLKEGSK